MYPVLAKLISLDQAEAFLSSGWPEGAQPKLASQITALRREIPAHLLKRFDQLKGQDRVPVVSVIRGVCQGCGAPLPKPILSQLDAEEIVCCEQCNRFLYAAEQRPSGGSLTEGAPAREEFLAQLKSRNL